MATYAKIRRLTEKKGEDVDKTFRRLANHLRDTGRTGSLRCTLLVANGRRHFTFDFEPGGCRMISDTTKKPDLELIAREDTFWEIAEARLSPLDAFLQGRLRVLGDINLGSHLMRQVAEGSGATSICGG